MYAQLVKSIEDTPTLIIPLTLALAAVAGGLIRLLSLALWLLFSAGVAVAELAARTFGVKFSASQFLHAVGASFPLAKDRMRTNEVVELYQAGRAKRRRSRLRPVASVERPPPGKKKRTG